MSATDHPSTFPHLAGIEIARRVLETHRFDFKPRSFGTVSSIGSGVARVAGLRGIGHEELIRFDQDSLGIAFNVGSREIGVVLLDSGPGLAAGSLAEGTKRVSDVPVGEALLGRVIDPGGRPLDGSGVLRGMQRHPAETPAPGIMDRAPVSVPLQTGLKVIDALVPIGRGQRELILGDRQTGKTAIAVDTILNQHRHGVVCIYCAVGKRATAAAKVIDTLQRNGAMEYSCVVVATEQDPPGVQFIAPYAATAIGEFFMRRGRDVLLVLDDLTRHARAYRELSLLLRRPPGREAFPGDIFYVHSRLLERATHLKDTLGGGSLTALPIVETEAQNMSAYIPTNLISITDGQIYLSPSLFSKGHLPAVDVGRSVSRVGGKTQLPAYRKVSADLRLAYSQFEELESFSRFGTRMEKDTRRALKRGRRVREILKQDQYRPLKPWEQVAALWAVNQGIFDGVDLEDVGGLEDLVRIATGDALPDLCEKIDAGKALEDAELEALSKTAHTATEEYRDRKEPDR